MPAVAITDHGNMFGAFKFFAACKKHGVKPILGAKYMWWKIVLIKIYQRK